MPEPLPPPAAPPGAGLAPQGSPAASAVPPIPGLSAVPPIPALSGNGPRFEEAPRRWPLVLAIVVGVLVVGGGGLWVFFGPTIRKLLLKH